MKFCRFRAKNGQIQVGLLENYWLVVGLEDAGITSLTGLLENLNQFKAQLNSLPSDLPRWPLDEITLLPPVEGQEIWAAGVTYLRSKKARMEESGFAIAYDKVYEADRPELFFKSLPEKVVGPLSDVGVRLDSHWNVPEPELALVINSKGEIIGYTLGNDMSSRDIEGANLLYLPQAKIYSKSCAIGPWIVTGVEEREVRSWSIQLEIWRGQEMVFQGETLINHIQRPFQQLVDYLFRSQEFPKGAILLTGTGVIPPDSFTLQPQDRVLIHVPAIGLLENRVVAV
jgi:2-dehydro-3-deoxy-D-arabinonate dehydratase